MMTLSGTAFAANAENTHPSAETTQITSTKSDSLSDSLNVINPQSLSRPTSGTNLPYSGSFSGVNGEIFSNYYFYTNGATQFYVDWNVRPDYPIKTYWHINVYEAGTNDFVLSSSQFNTTDYTGNWTTRFYNLDSAYNYYISFVNDGPPSASSLSGNFTARLN